MSIGQNDFEEKKQNLLVEEDALNEDLFDNFLEWNEKEIVIWLKVNILKNLSTDIDQLWIKNQLKGQKLMTLNDFMLQNQLLINNKFVRDTILFHIQKIISFQSDCWKAISYKQWSIDQTISWINSILQVELNQKQIENFSKLEVKGDILFNLNKKDLQEIYDIQNQDQINTILDEIKLLQTEESDQEQKGEQKEDNQILQFNNENQISQDNENQSKKQNRKKENNTKQKQVTEHQINLTDQKFFLNEQYISQNNSNLIQPQNHTFYCYFKSFPPNCTLKILFIEKQTWWKDIITPYLMNRIIGTNIFYAHINLNEQKQFCYKYQLDYNNNPSFVTHYSVEINRNIDYRIIYDTPDNFGSFCCKSKLKLQNYTIFYAQNITQIPIQFFVSLINFVQKLITYNDQKQLLILDENQNLFKSLPLVNKLIYIGVLKKQDLLKRYSQKFALRIRIQEINNQFDMYDEFTEQTKEFFIIGLSILIQQDQMIEALKLHRNIRNKFPTDFWKFEIKQLPSEYILKEIEFYTLNQLIIDNLFEKIAKYCQFSMISIFKYIIILQPSIKSQIISIKEQLSYYKQKRANMSEFEQEFTEYFQAQNDQIKQQLLIDDQMRSTIINTQNTLDLSIDLICKDQYVKLFQKSQVLTILIDITKIQQLKQSQSFIDNFEKLVLLICEFNKEEFLLQLKLLSNQLFQIISKHPEIYYELIKSLNILLNNNIIEVCLVDSLIVNFKNKININFKFNQELHLLTQCNFFKIIEMENQNRLLSKIFNIKYQKIELDQFSFSLINDDEFLDTLKILKPFILISQCQILSSVYKQITQIVQDFNSNQISLFQIRKLLKVNFSQLVKFTDIIDVEFDKKQLEYTFNQFKKQEKKILGLSQFSKLMQTLNIPKYKEIVNLVQLYYNEDSSVSLQQFQSQSDMQQNYQSLKFLRNFNDTPLVQFYLQSMVKDLQQNKDIQLNETDLDQNIMQAINLIKEHLIKIRQYKIEGDRLTLKDIFNFWKFGQTQLLKKQKVLSIVNELEKYFNNIENQIPHFDFNSPFIQDIVNLSQFYQNKCTIQQLFALIQTLKLEKVKNYTEDCTILKNINYQITEIDELANQQDQNFSQFIQKINLIIQDINRFVPSKLEIQKLFLAVQRTEKLIEYFNQLEKDKIQLEDLVDVIDDTSMETDALVQQMMNVRNVLQHIRTGYEEKQNLIDCLISRYKKYEHSLKQSDKLENTIYRCIENLDMISEKIQSQSDKSIQIIQTVKNFYESVMVKIEMCKNQSESTLKFITQNILPHKTEQQVLNFEDLNLLCNRFKLIKNNKKSNIQNEQQQSSQRVNRIDQNICNNLEEMLSLSVEIKLILDNLKNLGHIEFLENRYSLKNSLNDIIPQLIEDLQTLKLKNTQHANNLQEAREKYLSLNFYHPLTFELIENIKKYFNQQEKYQYNLNKLIRLTKFINEIEAPNLEQFNLFMQEQSQKKDLEKMDLYGQALDKLLILPKIEEVINKPNELGVLTNGQQIECRRIKSYDLLLKSIVTIFLAHNQKPTSWQIFFCSQNTNLLDLEQFAYLAKNAAKNYIYRDQKPLFLICSFESLSIQTQMLFIDLLDQMYKYKETINLLITYIGNFEQESSMHILQRFKYAFQVDCQHNNSELMRFSNISSLNSISMHISEYSGFGKTYQINKICEQNSQQPIEIPIYGETTKLELIELINKKIQIMEKSNSSMFRLHINLFDLKTEEIHSILFQLLILRKIGHSQSFFAQIPAQMLIQIEIQNTFQDKLWLKVKYLEDYINKNQIFYYKSNYLQLDNRNQCNIKGIDIDQFQIKNNPNINFVDLQLSLQYLRNYENISNFQISNQYNQQDLVMYLEKELVSEKEAIKLIKKHFLNKLENNFSFYHITVILKFFCKQVILFHKTVYLDISNLNFQNIGRQFRQKVFQGIINTSVPYSCQIMSNNYQNQQEQMKQNYYNALEQRNNNIKGWDDNLGNNDDFFLTISQSGSLIPIFQNIQSVPQYYQDYCKNMKSPIEDWNQLKSIQDDVLVNLCTPARNILSVKEDLAQNFSDIAITKTIARKICFLYIKIHSDIPTLIMGETGVGKTIIVRYLSSLMNSVVFTLDVHAGLTQNEIIQWVNYFVLLNSQTPLQLKQLIEDLNEELFQNPENEKLLSEKNVVTKFFNFKTSSNQFQSEDYNDQKVILFFDEINTNQNIDGVLKELLVEKKIQGKLLPKCFVPIAAANPYKFKSKNDNKENTDSLKITGCENQQTSRLIYHVYPLAESMNTFIWQFGELLADDELKIVSKMVFNASQKQEYQIVNFQNTLIQTITGCQQFSRSKQSVRSVSLRDVSRFLKVFIYFKTVWNKNLADSLLFSVFFSYYCRFNNINIREELCNYLDNIVKVTQQEGRKSFAQNVKNIVNHEMDQVQGILDHSQFYKQIAFTSTLKENLFMILISVLNNIPIIMVGPPGSSKTLCTRLLYNSMKGKKSNIEFFKKLPNLIYKTYQCSILSTSDSIEKAFKSAKQLDNNINKQASNEQQQQQQESCQNIVAIILDEIGLAEASKSNPLKVLHRLLEYQNNVPMIGLSNWSLDASKMNRVVFANRPKLSENELIEAATILQGRINPSSTDSDQCLKIVINLAKDSFNYFQQDKDKIFFHGTRDFYNCVIFVCNQMKNNKEQSEEINQKIILTGILRNFGGSRDMMETLNYFKLSIGQNIQLQNSFNLNQYNPTELIEMNIKDKNCRNLMIISNKPDHALQYTEKLCKDRLFKIFQGSDLQDDFVEYNTLKMLNEIITCMEEGYLVIMYSLESLYQSFYDLFNQNYVELAAKNYCRIAIGSDSIRSQVHSNFKVILIAQAKDVYDQRQTYDPPLLNRFEKQFLDLKFLLKDNELGMKKQLNELISQCSIFSFQQEQVFEGKKQKFGVQDMFPIIQESNNDDILFSLILKNNDEQDEQKRVKKSFYELIDLASFSGIIRSHYLKRLDQKFYDYYIQSNKHFDFSQIIENLSKQVSFNENILESDQFIFSDQIQNQDYFWNQNNQENLEIKQQFEDVNFIGQNLIVYTTEYYNYQQQQQQKNFIELEVKWLENIDSLKYQVQSYFNNDQITNLIVISSASDSITKLLYIKRTLQEERQIFQNKRQEKQQMSMKNIVLVIQLVNRQTNFIGISHDKYWKQIYVEDTSKPITCIDNIANYLVPISFMLQNEQNSIYQYILQECLPKIFAEIIFEKSKLSEKDIKKRLQTYNELLENQTGLQLNYFIKEKIIEKIEDQCNQISRVYGKCEWYQLVALQEKNNRDNNKFISSLKQYAIQQSLTVLAQIFYAAEKNNVISSLMSKKFQFNQQQVNLIIELWLAKFNEVSENDRICDQIKFEYPFFNAIKLSLEQFKQMYLEIFNNEFQIEEKKQSRYKNYFQQEQEVQIEQNQMQIDNCNDNYQIKYQDQSFSEIYRYLVNLTSINDPLLRQIYQFNPQLYFENLSKETEYQWIQNKTIQRIIIKLADHLVDNITIECYHSILWVNQQIFTDLSQIWLLSEEESPDQFESIYSKFEQRIEILLKNHNINQNDSYVDCSQTQKNNQNEQEDQEQNLNILENIWCEIFIFSANLIEIFIIQNEKMYSQNQKQNVWVENLKNCLGIIENCSSDYVLYPQEMIQQLSKIYFVLKIFECLNQQQNLRSLIKNELYGLNNEFQSISFSNYLKVKQNFISACEESKKNELILRLIWQLLKCEDFNQDFMKYSDEILKDIVSFLSALLLKIDYNKIQNNQYESHQFVFTKRIMEKIIEKIFQEFQFNENDEFNDMFDPRYNKNIMKMSQIFSSLKIEKSNPICSLIVQIIGKFEYYSIDKILDFIAIGQDIEDAIEINEGRVSKLEYFLERITQRQEDETLINIIEFKLCQELCMAVCKFIHENYLFQKREDKEQKNSILNNYNTDRIRKNRLIEIFDKSLKSNNQRNDQINPILPMMLVKILKVDYKIQDVQILSNQFEAFKDDIFFVKIDYENIWDNQLGKLGIDFNSDLKIQKKLTNLEQTIEQSYQNTPQLYFNLTNLISQVILKQDLEDFNLMVLILNQINKVKINVQLIIEINLLFGRILSKNQNIPQALQKVFVMNLIMTTFLDKNSFISQLYEQQIDIQNIFIPFMVDSDSILRIQDELKTAKALRRYQCKNCIAQQKNPSIYIIGDCCMPVSNLKECSQCGNKPVVQNHYSNDIEPPKLISGQQEPIFVKEIQDYKNYDSFYKQKGFPYELKVQKIDEFIQNREKVDLGFQQSFSLLKINKMRELYEKDQILFGRIFMLSIICFYCHLIQKNKGQEEACKIIGQGNPYDIFLMIYSNETNNLIEQNSSWNLILQVTQCNEEYIMNYFILKIVKNFLITQSNMQSADKLDFKLDQNRILFEKEFVQKILDLQALKKIKNFTNQLKKDQLNYNQLKDMIINTNLENPIEEYTYLKQYKDLLSRNFSVTKNDFDCFIQNRSSGIQAKFFKMLVYYSDEIDICSIIFQIQNFIKIFNLKTFDKITQKESQEIELLQFVKENHLQKEFEEFKLSWNKIRSLIQQNKIKIGVDCANIDLDDIDMDNQKIDILCYSDDIFSRGYPLYLLLNYLKSQHNSFLLTLEKEFGQIFNKFNNKKYLQMNKRNFIPKNIFSNHEPFSQQFFENIVETQCCHHPFLEYEQEVIFDMSELTNQFIEKFYQQVTKIEEPQETDLAKLQLKKFRFKGDQQTINFVREIVDKIDQKLYPEAQNNPNTPLLYINLQNNETCIHLLDVLKTTMSILIKINSNQKISGQILLAQFLQDFGIQSQGLNFDKEKIKLCHLLYIYELAERISFERLFKEIYPLFMIETSNTQKESIKLFCEQQTDLDLDIFMQAIGRMIVRMFCNQTVQIASKQGLFQFFEESKDDCINFWGIEYQNESERLIFKMNWNENYEIFQNKNPNKITLDQAYHFYKDILSIRDQKLQQQKQLEIIQQKRRQKDQEMIEKELLANNQYSQKNQDKRKKMQKNSKIDFR